MVRHDDERRTTGRRLEDLGDRLAGDVPHVLVDLGERLTDRDHRVGAVDDRVHDRVGRRCVVPDERSRGGHVGPHVRPGRLVQPVDEVGERDVRRPVTEVHRVLDLLERDHVRAQLGDRGDDLVPLDRELGGIARSAGQRVLGGEGGEVVEHVERGDDDVPADALRRGGPRVQRDERRLGFGRGGRRDGRRRLEPPPVVAVVQDEGQALCVQRVTDPDHGVRGQVRLGRPGDLVVATVVEDDDPVRVVRGDRLGFRPGRHLGGALHRHGVPCCEPHAAVTIDLVQRGDQVVTLGRDEHPLVLLPVRPRERVRQGHRLRQVHTGLDDLDQVRRPRRVDLGEAVVLAGHPGHLDQVADLGGRGPVTQVDEDAVRRARGCVVDPTGAGCLHVEPGVPTGAVVGGHHTVHRHRLAGVLGGVPGALHLSDRVGRFRCCRGWDENGCQRQGTDSRERDESAWSVWGCGHQRGPPGRRCLVHRSPRTVDRGRRPCHR